jgi:hypothetical protein
MKYSEEDKFENKKDGARSKIIEVSPDTNEYILMVYDEHKPGGYEHPISEDELDSNWSKDNRYRVEGHF